MARTVRHLDDPPLTEIVERQRSRLADRALRDTGEAADILVCRRSDFEARRHLRASLPGTVLGEGKLVHGATLLPGTDLVCS